MDESPLTRELSVLLTVIVRALVTNEEAVCVSWYPGPDEKMVLRVEVSAADRGKLIGEGGKIAHSIRTIFLSIARKNGGNYVLELTG